MMPITPSGTRTCWMSRPFGRLQRLISSPTGSGRAAICSSPTAIASTRVGVSVRRSRNAGATPAARAASTSSALAASELVGARAQRAAAPACSAAFFSAVEARARAGRGGAGGATEGDDVLLEAAHDGSPLRERLATSGSRRSRRTRRVAVGALEAHEVVAMDDLVAHLVAERRLDLARVAALDLVELGGAVAHEPARELAAVEVDALDAGADAEAPAHLAQARRRAGSGPARRSRAARRRRRRPCRRASACRRSSASGSRADRRPAGRTCRRRRRPRARRRARRAPAVGDDGRDAGRARPSSRRRAWSPCRRCRAGRRRRPSPRSPASRRRRRARARRRDACAGRRCGARRRRSGSPAGRPRAGSRSAPRGCRCRRA